VSGGAPRTARPEIVFYWRRGCLFCALLRRKLRAAGLTWTERDIWADDDAAAFVRQHARGNETVPTVAVGDEVLVNPSIRRVLDARERALRG
jgi:glutaredoxin